MTNNSPPNSFFSLIMDKESDNESAGKQGYEEGFAENEMVKADAPESQLSESAMGLGESTSRSSEDEALASSVMQSDSALKQCLTMQGGSWCT